VETACQHNEHITGCSGNRIEHPSSGYFLLQQKIGKTFSIALNHWKTFKQNGRHFD
jgi:hypothetical protein